MDEEVDVVNVLDGNAHVSDPRCRHLRGDLISAHGENMCDFVLGQRARRTSGVNTIRKSDASCKTFSSTDLPT